jgi:UDP-2,3-diacylglucosamine hydrolase
MTENAPSFDSQIPCFALLAGGGDLPLQVIQNLNPNSPKPYVIGLKEFSPTVPCDTMISVGQIGRLLDLLRARHLQHICLAGYAYRPLWYRLRLDGQGILFLMKLFPKLKTGDDSLLSKVLQLLQNFHLTPLSIKDICPNLQMPLGGLTRVPPTKTQEQSLHTGVSVLDKLSNHDMGQAIAMAGKVILAIETIEGTDAMIKRCQELPAKRIGALPPPVFIKASKKGQTSYADLPVFGLQTIQHLHQAGFAGAFLEAGSVLMLDAQEVLDYADKHHLFMAGFTR